MKTSVYFPELSREIEELKHIHLYRELRVLEESRGTKAKIGGKNIVLFCSNDYLGLSQHPKVIQAFEKGAREFGVGSGASRLISGTSKITSKLEERIAHLKGKDRALLFSTGYLVNLGVISAFCGKEDLVIVDKLNHASILDACKLSGARIRVYPHKDMDYLEKILKQSKRFQKKLIVTDSVFSMDGDLAPLREIAELKNRYGAYLMIDEAHGTGVFGEKGSGAAEFLGVQDQIDLSMGTCSKAIGTLGGFVAGDRELIDYLINKSRPFIFSTALPPAILTASLESLNLIEKEPPLRKSLWSKIHELRSGLEQMEILLESDASPIIPIVTGEEEKTKMISDALFNDGFLIPAIRYPAVPKGKARLRITISALHQNKEIKQLLRALKDALRIKKKGLLDE